MIDWRCIVLYCGKQKLISDMRRTFTHASYFASWDGSIKRTFNYALAITNQESVGATPLARDRVVF